MSISVLDLFTIGIGPSSSHTVGPMRAANRFVTSLADSGLLIRTAAVRAELFGSLGATGHGHGSPKAIMFGLLGYPPEHVDPDRADDIATRVGQTGRLLLGGAHDIGFAPDDDICLHRRKTLPGHPNGMVFRALDTSGNVLAEKTYYSVGGGFVADHTSDGARGRADDWSLRWPFGTAAELLAHASAHRLPVSAVMLTNEAALRPEADTRAGLLAIWQAMTECVRRGCSRDGCAARGPEGAAPRP
jgi:L-serine dehydratase